MFMAAARRTSDVPAAAVFLVFLNVNAVALRIIALDLIRSASGYILLRATRAGPLIVALVLLRIILLRRGRA
jgi:hypothetical protein